jgi:RNA polymerase primary sigma factor
MAKRKRSESSGAGANLRKSREMADSFALASANNGSIAPDIAVEPDELGRFDVRPSPENGEASEDYEWAPADADGAADVAEDAAIDRDEDDEAATDVEQEAGSWRNHPSSENLLQHYFNDIGKIPLLSNEETILLAKKIEQARGQKDTAALAEAKSKLVSANLRLVIRLAKKYSRCGMPLIDLIQAGNIGLIKAIDGFDYKRGFKFSTYASSWILASIRRTISNQARTVRLPINFIPVLGLVRRTSQKLARELGRRPTVEEVSKDSGVNPKKINSMSGILHTPMSLDFPMDDEHKTFTFGEILGDRNGPSVSEMVDRRLFREQLESVMKEALDEREQEVLRLRYGLEDGYEYNQSEIADRLKLSRQRVSQIEGKALLKLRSHSQSRSLKTFLN